MIKLQNPVLVVIDMQNGFLGSRSNYIIPSVVRVVEECQKRGIPTVFTRFHNRDNSPYERLIGWTRLRTPPETDLTPELTQFADIIIDKDFYSSFTQEFTGLVEKNGWQTLILCGVATESCVMKTAVDAFERQLTPLVVTDACASHAGDDVHTAGLMILGRYIGKEQLITTNDLVEKIDLAASALGN